MEDAGGGRGGRGKGSTVGRHELHMQFWVECYCASHVRATARMSAIVVVHVATGRTVHALMFLNEAESSAYHTFKST